MSKIFCLETEWEQSIHDLKRDSSVKPLLEFLFHTAGYNGFDNYTFRQVACKEDFEYYLNHLTYKTYDGYDIVYLCFHGRKEKVCFANGSIISILDFAKEHEGIFQGKNIHFGSCSTLKMNEDDILEFKRLTAASMVTGYQKTVDMVDSFIFETWLINAITKHPDYKAKRIMNLVESEMPYFKSKLQFVAY